jgi:hypothetical protein
MRSAIVLCVMFVCVGCSWLESLFEQKKEPDNPSCEPKTGPLPNECTEYTQNASWLPDAYVRNAFCACSKTPDSPTANCVRGYLREALANAGDLKTQWGEQKKKLEDGGAKEVYDAYVLATITPVIYRWHADAYESCCCKLGPAPYPDWIGVTTVNLEDCSVVNEMIDLFGSCHGTPGRW